MGYTYYRLMALIPSDTALSMSDVTDALQRRFSGIQPTPVIHTDDKTCTLKWGNWQFRVYWEDEPHVAEESREIVELFASERADRERIAACSRRITTAADDDPDMEHFNDYVYVIETLESFEGVYVFDPSQGKFIDE